MKIYTILFSLLILVSGCGDTDSQKDKTMERGSIKEALAGEALQWLAIDGVTMVYQGATEEGESCIKVEVEELTDDIRKKIPSNYMGFEVIIEEGGKMEPKENSH